MPRGGAEGSRKPRSGFGEAATRRQRLLIQEGWNTYSAMLPAHTPAVQMRETRRAFYGGALALLETLLDGIPSEMAQPFARPGEDTVIVDEAMTGDLQARANRHGDFAEINAFADDLEAERA